MELVATDGVYGDWIYPKMKSSGTDDNGAFWNPNG